MATVLAVGSPVTVRLVKDRRPDVSYSGVVEFDDGTRTVIRAPWSGAPAKNLGVVRFEEGDVFTEHYWRDRWYSVKEVRDNTGRLKGWYCDVAKPAVVEPNTVISADLYLDLWMSADGSIIVRLDEDEFAASGFELAEPAAAAHARAALDELENIARSRGIGALLRQESPHDER